MLHAFHVPLAGHVLSINQALILTLNSKEEHGRLAAFQSSTRISTTTALAKLLSPAGRVFTPMTAILIQGYLFSFGVLVFGNNLMGILVGSLTLSVWGFIQGLILPYALFGLPLFQAVLNLWSRLSEALTLPYQSLYWILLGGILIKALATVLITGYAWFRDSQFDLEYATRVNKLKPLISQKPQNRIFHPWFLISFAMTGFSVWLTGQVSRTEIILTLARPVVLGIFLWYLAGMIKAGSRAKFISFARH